MDPLTENFTSFLVQQTLRFLDLRSALQHSHYIRPLFIAATTTMADRDRVARATSRRLPTTARPAAPKLLVIRFLNAHLAHDGLERHSYEMLYRMIMMISAIGKSIHVIVQTDIAHASALRQIERYAACVSEGCDVFRRHFEAKGQMAERATERLPRLDCATEESGLEPMLILWDRKLSKLHLPTGNDARLFRHLANHYDDQVYLQFLQLHRKRPENKVWDLHEVLTALRQQLEDLHEICTAADMLVEALETEHATASIRLQREKAALVPPRTATVLESAMSLRAKTSPIPNEPPRLPPLHFDTGTILPRADSLDPRAVQSASSSRRPTITQSFSTVEEDVSGRASHFRNATISDTGYVAQPRGLGIENLAQPTRGPAVGVRRKGSASAVPRVFTGLGELEEGVRKHNIHKVETPERTVSPIEEHDPEVIQQSVKARDFAESPERSPVSPLQRREAVVSKEAQWESRLLSNGEVVQSRRPPAMERPDPHRAQILDDRGDGLKAWIDAELKKNRGRPDTPRRGDMRHRENTL